jgi:predicted aldo/keto reductase-like oxidoreductase
VANDALPRTLTSEKLSIMTPTRDTYWQLMNVAGMGCGYWIPYVAGVDIPDCFSSTTPSLVSQRPECKISLDLTSPRFLSDVSYADYAGHAGDVPWPDPQNIYIPERLKEVSYEMERTITVILLFLRKNCSVWISWGISGAGLYSVEKPIPYHSGFPGPDREILPGESHEQI